MSLLDAVKDCISAEFTAVAYTFLELIFFVF